MKEIFMKGYRLLIGCLFAISLLLLTSLPVWVGAQEHTDMETELPAETLTLIHEVREATARFHDIDVALEAGYGKLLECFQHGPDRGMGQHYANGELVGDGVLDALQPEALVYEPRADGTMTLVAFEYIVPAALWDPEDTGREPPVLFGQEFSLKTNIPDTPPIWAKHIWLWSHNPEGLFADYNPLIVCPPDQPITEMAMQ
jgi:hypothetical protein